MGIASRYVAWTESLLENKTLWRLFVCINIAGAIFGVFTYNRTMSQTSPWLWIMLVDCPAYPAVMVFLLTFRKNKLVQKFSFFAFYGLIKYGLWTIVAWSIYNKEFLGHNTLVNGLVFIGHFGMVLEAGFVARRAAKSTGFEVVLPVAWMLTNDFFDYVVGTHPPLPDGSYVGLLLAQNLIVDIIIPAFLFLVVRRELYRKKQSA